MKTEIFNYDLPRKLIAQNPPAKRGTTRLLVLNRDSGKIEHKKYLDIPSYIKKGDVVVLNKTKVIWARIFPTVQRTGKQIEVLFLEKRNKDYWYCLVGRAKDVKIGDILKLNEFEIKVVNRKSGEAGFLLEAKNADKLMGEYGHVPLPPYIKRRDILSDKERYNTVFSQDSGSVAAPTASLNLTSESIQQIKNAGAKICYINLQIGWGTFAPLNTENVEDFDIHGEYVEVGKDTVNSVNNCKGRVWAFGTTVVRALEGVSVEKGKIKEFKGIVDLFIYPGYDFKIVDILVTNFHAPKTSLLTLVSAFANKSPTGERMIFKAYEVAKRHRYKFLSYGDSMLIT